MSGEQESPDSNSNSWKAEEGVKLHDLGRAEKSWRRYQTAPAVSAEDRAIRRFKIDAQRSSMRKRRCTRIGFRHIMNYTSVDRDDDVLKKNVFRVAVFESKQIVFVSGKSRLGRFRGVSKLTSNCSEVDEVIFKEC